MSVRGNIEFEYQQAVKSGNARRIQTLIRHGEKPPQRIMLYALICDRPELLELLQSAGADPDDMDGFCETALGRAVNRFPPDVAKLLLELGADPNKESLHLLPLVHAVIREKVEQIHILIDGGADANFKQWNGLTPLLVAVQCEDIDATRLLLQAGGDPAIKGPDGRNALQTARMLKNSALVELIDSFDRKQNGETQ